MGKRIDTAAVILARLSRHRVARLRCEKTLEAIDRAAVWQSVCHAQEASVHGEV